jgi:arylsulfatase A-like enzyme
LLYDQTQKVLLTIKDKKLPLWNTIENQVRLVDVFPTIMSLFDFQEKLDFDWVSLVDMVNNKERENLVWYSETFYPEEQKEFQNVSNKKSIRIDNKEKVIVHLNSDPIEIYDLVNDPNESNNRFKYL